MEANTDKPVTTCDNNVPRETNALSIGYDGPRCEVKTITVGGKMYVEIKVLEDLLSMYTEKFKVEREQAFKDLVTYGEARIKHEQSNQAD